MDHSEHFLTLECKGCHTEFEAKEDSVPFYFPVCEKKVDRSCEIDYEREENKA